MTDQQGFREIQLSGKQLVFLFMASVVLAVGVFLLGVSVGRGVRQNVGPGAATPAESTPESEAVAVMPPPTTLSAEDTQFNDDLQGKAPGPMNSPTPPPSPEPTSTVPPATTTQPAAPDSSTAKPASPMQGWMLQVGAFKSRENADSEVRRLVAKGYSAVVVTGGSLFRVRVGPYAQRADADRAATRLSKEEGLTPSVIR
jgi:DedD protein